MGTGYCQGCMERIATYPCPKCGYTPSYDTSPYTLQPGTVLNGKYLVGRVLGQGGFGITYIGIDLHLQRKVAIKEYYPAGFAARRTGSSEVIWYSTEAAQQARISGQDLVLKEARKISRLSGIEPVVQVFNVFQENGTAYICMDFIEGHTLQHHLKRTGPLTWEQTRAIFLPIILTMDQIHKLGLIHRDISPDNLMIQPNGNIKILDLGAAKDLNLNSGKSSMQVAKSGFSPLEQYIQSGNSGPWTDVYAMAATMYYTLTGQVPPTAIDRMDHDTLRWDFPQLQALPAPVLQAMQHALTIRSSERTQTMELFAQELQRTVTKKKSPKNPPKKRPLGAIAAIAAVAVLAGAAFAATRLPGKKSGTPPTAPPPSADSAPVVDLSDMDLQKRIDQVIKTCTLENYTYSNGSRLELYFDDQDRECLRIFINDAGQDEFIFLAEYDSQGNVLELYGLEGEDLMRYTTWIRKDNGDMIRRLQYEGNGTLIDTLEITYDSQGREASRTRTDGTGNVLLRASSTYDSKGRETYSGTYDNGNRFVTHYDENGNVIDSITKDSNDKQISRTSYTYDTNGNTLEYSYYDEKDKLSYQCTYHYSRDLEIGKTSTSIYDGKEYTYDYEYLFGPMNVIIGERCTGDYNSVSEYVEDMLSFWRIRDYTAETDYNSNTAYYYNWDGDMLYSEQYDESGKLTYYSENLYDENGKQTGSKTIWYNEDGGYDVSINDLDYNTVYTEYYNDRDELTKRTEYLYDANGEHAGSISTEYQPDGSYTVVQYNANYYTDVSKSYDSSGTLLSMEEFSYDLFNKRTGSVLTTYYYDGSYTVTVKDANYKVVSEKTYDAHGNLIKSS